MGLISRESALEAVKIPNGEYPNPSERHGIIIARVEARRRIREIPSVPAVTLDKLCELFQEAVARVPCALCSKIVPEWCKENNNIPLSWYGEWKCPTWKQLLTKWMEEQNA